MEYKQDLCHVLKTEIDGNSVMSACDTMRVIDKLESLSKKIERRDAIAKGMRKYEPCNCAKTTRFVFNKAIMLVNSKDEAEEMQTSHRLPALTTRREKCISPIHRFNTPTFRPNDQSPTWRNQPQVSLRGRDLSLPKVSTKRSLTPDPWLTSSPSKALSKWSYSKNTTPRSPVQVTLDSIPTISTADNTGFIDDHLFSGYGPATQESSEAASPVLEPRYHSPEPPIHEEAVCIQNCSAEQVLERCDRMEEVKTLLKKEDCAWQTVKQMQRDIENYIDFLPEVAGQKSRFGRVVRFLRKYKVVRQTEFIDKDAAEKCLNAKSDVSVYVNKRFGKPKIWRHEGRIISNRLDNEIRSYWNLL